PLIINSPIEPFGNSFPVSSTILLSVFGIGIPTLPVFLTPPGGFLCDVGLVSVKPKPSPITAFVNVSNLFITSIGIGAEPQEQHSQLLKHYSLILGVFTNALYVLGSPGKNVGLYYSIKYKA